MTSTWDKIAACPHLTTRMFKIYTLICVISMITIGSWYYFTYCHVYVGEVDYKPAPIDPEELKAYEIEIFREYLRIPTVHPNVNYEPCVTFLKRQARSLDLPINIYYPVNDKSPMVVITWLGSQPELPSISLGTHMDVVPVYSEQWTHPPFAAEIDDKGRIFARGAQDNKPAGTQYLAAIRALKMGGVERLNRTIHVIYAPNEEIGGIYGWKDFVHTDEFRALNIGFHLDEGRSSQNQNFLLRYAERVVFSTTVEISGESGHGSLILPNTIGPKVRYMIDKMMDFRAFEEKRLKENANLTVSDVTTINLTMMKGGLQYNIVPRNVTLVFDVRVAIDVNLVQLKKMFEQWAREAGDGVTVYQILPSVKSSKTEIGDSNPYWVAFHKAANQLNITLQPDIAAGGTDARYIREMNIPALGFAAINQIPPLLHANDEYVSVDMYLRGIDIYKTIIPALANVE